MLKQKKNLCYNMQQKLCRYPNQRVNANKITSKFEEYLTYYKLACVFIPAVGHI
jgi:hypothetical protein